MVHTLICTFQPKEAIALHLFLNFILNIMDVLYNITKISEQNEDESLEQVSLFAVFLNTCVCVSDWFG